jgi:hypothetical protein
MELLDDKTIKSENPNIGSKEKPLKSGLKITNTTLLLYKQFALGNDDRDIEDKLNEFTDVTPVQDVQCLFRDHIIKCFMLIFTNDHSQHLLLNQDLIEIATSCLENIDTISLEA